MSRNSSHGAASSSSPANANAGVTTRCDTKRSNKIQITIPLQRQRRKPLSNGNPSFQNSSNTNNKGFICTRKFCKICSSAQPYVPMSPDLIYKLECDEYFNAVTSEELFNFKKRYSLEREHALHKGPAPKWLKRLRLCADAHDAILRSYVRPPPIVIQKYNAHALVNGKQLVPENWTRHREDREFKAKHGKQRRQMGLVVPAKPSRQEQAATSVFSWSVGYRFDKHASQHVYYRKASVRFPLANHVILGMTAVLDLREFISSMLTTTSLSVGRHFTTTGLTPLVGETSSIIVASFEVELCIKVENRMLEGGVDNTCTTNDPPQIMRVIKRSCFRIVRFTPFGIPLRYRLSDYGIQMDHTYLDTSECDWGPAPQGLPVMIHSFLHCRVGESLNPLMDDSVEYKIP